MTLEAGATDGPDSRHPNQIAYRRELRLTDPWDLKKILDLAKWSVGLTKRFDSLGQDRPDPWKGYEVRGCGSIERDQSIRF